MADRCFDIAIIGGGIVGLATCLEITRTWPKLKLLLVEKEAAVGLHQSSHNSGVIHSGIYYKPGSLKAKLCVDGSRKMVEFCQEHGIKHKITGKLIVATSDQELPYLQTLLERGQANGLEGLRELDPEQIREIEPHCIGVRGIHVPSAGIADYLAVCQKYAELIMMRGGEIRTATRVTAIISNQSEIILESTQGSFFTKKMINCAGLHSDRVGRLAGEKPQLQIIPFRGEYYDLVPKSQHLVKTLIYPVPDPRFPFLGVHFTQRVHGGVDAGPNAVLALKREGYRWRDVSVRDTAQLLGYKGFWHMAQKHWRTGLNEIYRSLSKASFVKALQKLVPQISASDLVTDGSGVRAQAVKSDGSLVDDFQFIRRANILNVYNVPSPAATASIAVGQQIAQMAGQEFEFSGF